MPDNRSTQALSLSFRAISKTQVALFERTLDTIGKEGDLINRVLEVFLDGTVAVRALTASLPE